jgi:hypothetical protein
MKSFYVENIFDEETYRLIKDYVYNHMETSDDFNYAPYYGRYWNLIDFPEDLYGKIIDKAREKTGIKDLDIAYTQCIKYKKEGESIPRLDNHIDNFYAVYTLDITIKTTLDWPLTIEDVDVSCKDNSAIFLKGDEDFHSRPEYPGTDEDYMVMLYVNLVPQDHPIMRDVEKLKALSKPVKDAFLKTVIPNNVNKNAGSKTKKLPWGDY